MNGKVIFILMALLVGSYAQDAAQVKENIEEFVKDLKAFVQKTIDQHKGQDDIEIIKEIIVAIHEQVEEFIEKKALSLIEEGEIKEIINEHKEEIREFIIDFVKDVKELAIKIALFHKNLEKELDTEKRNEIRQHVFTFVQELKELVQDTVLEHVGEEKLTIIYEVLYAVHEHVQNFIENATLYIESNPDVQEKFGEELQNIRDNVLEIIEDVHNVVERVKEELNN